MRGEGTHRFGLPGGDPRQSGVSPVPRQPPHSKTWRQLGGRWREGEHRRMGSQWRNTPYLHGYDASTHAGAWNTIHTGGIEPSYLQLPIVPPK